MKTFAVLFFGFISLVRLNAQPLDSKPQATVQAIFFDAIKERALGNFDRAVALLKTAIEQEPDEPALYFELGKNLRVLKRYDLAEQAFLSANSLQPDDEWILNELYTVYGDMGAMDKLLPILQKLAERHPDYQEDLVSFYIEQGRYEEANEALSLLTSKYANTPSREEKRRLLERLMNPKQSLNKEEFSSLMSTANWDQALSTLRVTLTSSNELIEDKIALVKMISTEFIRTKPSELYGILEQSSLSNDLWVVMCKSEIQLVMSQFEESLRLSEEGLVYYPAQAKLYLLNGTALNKLHRWEEASAILEMGLAFVIPGNFQIAQFYDELIFAYSRLNQEEMVDLYRLKKADLK